MRSNSFNIELIDNVLGNIILIKLIQERGIKYDKRYYSENMTYYDTFFELYNNTFNYFSVNYRFIEYSYISVTKMKDSCMTEYYKLVYEINKTKSIKNAESEDIKAVHKVMDNTLFEGECYGIDYFLRVTSRGEPRLLVVTYEEYYPNARDVLNLFKFFDFFVEKLPELKAEYNDLIAERNQAA